MVRSWSLATLLLVLLVVCSVVRAPPPKGGSSRSSGSKPAAPVQESTGFFDALKSASGQVQHASDKFPVSYNMAATRFQSWAQENKDSIAKSAVDAFNFARTIFKPLEAEIAKNAPKVNTPKPSGSKGGSPKA
ncbi:hypothetical protein HPB50_000265 [Hyalomma asiaticum]|uniref:Uncharacterized protein n=1 Tax=Hyalomma asiaticum TaxID=266040 RepID=A0ACB7S702_HYAAI|nr:hypothetical protein HPB50_000265 [Hyalomma asiaticum]